MNNQLLEKTIGYKFKNSTLFLNALTHSSYTMENHMEREECNQRLEFLGDAVLDAVIGEKLFLTMTKEREGNLSKYRSLIVCEKSLADIGREIEIGMFLRLGRGLDSCFGRTQPSILADSVEALIGAIFLDGGFEEAKKISLFLFQRKLQQVGKENLSSDYKSSLQEEMQKNGPVTIQYKLVDETGPDHDKEFLIQVIIDGKLCGVGKGKSKKMAEQQGAKDVLTRRKKDVF